MNSKKCRYHIKMSFFLSYISWDEAGIYKLFMWIPQCYRHLTTSSSCERFHEVDNEPVSDDWIRKKIHRNSQSEWVEVVSECFFNDLDSIISPPDIFKLFIIVCCKSIRYLSLCPSCTTTKTGTTKWIFQQPLSLAKVFVCFSSKRLELQSL